MWYKHTTAISVPRVSINGDHIRAGVTVDSLEMDLNAAIHYLSPAPGSKERAAVSAMFTLLIQMAREDWHYFRRSVTCVTRTELVWHSSVTTVKKGRVSRDVSLEGATHVSFITQERVCLSWRVSPQCEQFIKYECYNSALLYAGYLHWWWVSRDSTKMKYWGGASGSGNCACGMTNSCAEPRYGCNWDKNDNVWREDSGLLTGNTHLPVKQFRFGDTGDNGEQGNHTLGKLKC